MCQFGFLAEEVKDRFSKPTLRNLVAPERGAEGDSADHIPSRFVGPEASSLRDLPVFLDRLHTDVARGAHLDENAVLIATSIANDGQSDAFKLKLLAVNRHGLMTVY